MRFMLAGLLFTALSSSSVWAHHSGLAFDHAKIITLTGIIRTYHFSQPHVWIKVLASTEEGAIEQWDIEGESPGLMARMGLNRKALRPGDNIVIRIHPLKDGRNAGSFVDITLEDGTYIHSVFEL